MIDVRWLRASEEARSLLTPKQRQIVTKAKRERARMRVVAQVRAHHWIRQKFDENQPRDETGKWTSGGGGGGGAEKPAPTAGGKSSASDLLKPTSATVSSIVGKIPGAAARIAEVKAKLDASVPTNATVDKGGHKQADGSWTPERAAVHDKVLSNMFTPEKMAAATPQGGQAPVMHLLGGRGGSGKSWFTGDNGSIDASKAIVLDNDAIKAALPEYEGWNAALLHEESREIGAAAERFARENGLNIVLDGTMRRTNEFEKKVDAYKAAGYRVEGHYMFLPPEISTERALKRFMGHGKTGRFVPPEYTLGSRTNEQSFDAVKGKMDAWEIYDNSGAAPKLHSRS